MRTEQLTPEERTERLLTLGWWNAMELIFQHWQANDVGESSAQIFRIVEYIHNI